MPGRDATCSIGLLDIGSSDDDDEDDRPFPKVQRIAGAGDIQPKFQEEMPTPGCHLGSMFCLTSAAATPHQENEIMKTLREDIDALLVAAASDNEPKLPDVGQDGLDDGMGEPNAPLEVYNPVELDWTGALACDSRDPSAHEDVELHDDADASDGLEGEEEKERFAGVVGVVSNEVPRLSQWRRLATMQRVREISFLHSKTHEQQHHRRRPEVSQRRHVWEHAVKAFHVDVLTTPLKHSTPDLDAGTAKSLDVVFQHFAPLLFQCRPQDVPTYRDPPAEMFERITCDEIRKQYIKLRAEIIPCLLQEPESASCWRVHTVTVLLNNGKQVQLKPEQLTLAQCDTFGVGNDDSIRLGRASTIGKRAHVVGFDTGHPLHEQVGLIKAYQKSADEAMVYKLLMTQSYSRVRAWGVWHILRLYLRLIMAGASTDALLELVGSFLTRHTRGAPARTRLGDVLNAVLLKSRGVNGDGQDNGFIGRALDIYFHSRPWHFQVGARQKRLRRNSHTGGLLAPSPALRRYRTELQIGVRFSWLNGPLRPCVAACGRRNLRCAGLSSDELARNPKAGVLLREISSGAARLRALLTLVNLAEPDRLDDRVWALVE